LCLSSLLFESDFARRYFKSFPTRRSSDLFDSLNWLEGIRPAIEAVRSNNKIAEASMCYTGNILDKGRQKYDLDYYVNLGKELENSGAHILGIKDMAGLLKPEAAYQLISTLKETVDIPI